MHDSELRGVLGARSPAKEQEKAQICMIRKHANLHGNMQYQKQSVDAGVADNQVCQRPELKTVLRRSVCT